MSRSRRLHPVQRHPAALGLAVCGLLAACTMGPDYRAPEVQLPATCKPVRHDGEVCLRAIDTVSCDKFATYVDDFAPATPGECDFCRLKPEPPPPAFVEAGADAP